jgi:hypothetical protein
MTSPRPELYPNVTPAVLARHEVLASFAVDAEEDFDWEMPVKGTPYSMSGLNNIRFFRELLSAFGVKPTYLLTYTVLEDEAVIRTLRREVERGDGEVGIQLHPWVNPPLEGPAGREFSFSGNLPGDLEERKLVCLMDRFRDVFGAHPTIYRAGRYGVGTATAGLLEKHGFRVDTSLAPRTNFAAEGGPDFSGYDSDPFWFGQNRRVLCVPLCRSIVGWAGGAAPAIYQALSTPGMERVRLASIITRSRLAERITLSPEGNDLPAMIRLVRGRLARGQRVFVISLHSSSFGVGQNPYVRSKSDLHHLFDSMSGILNYLADMPGMRFATLAELPDLLAPQRA